MGSARARRARRRGDIQLARRARRRGVCPCREPRIRVQRFGHLARCPYDQSGRWMVHLCVNDGDTGAFTGRLIAVEILDLTSGDTEMRLMGPWDLSDLDEGGDNDGSNDGAPITLVEPASGVSRKIIVGDRAFICRGWANAVGNWCWDGTTMRLRTARNLVKHLLALGFSIEEWVDEGPFADLAPRVADVRAHA